MRKAALLLVSSLTLFLLGNTNTHAQWEGAEVRRLTYVDVPNRVVGLYVDDTDELFLLYAEGIRDSATGFVYDYRLLYSTKEKDGDWSDPQEIQTPDHIIGQNRKSVVRYDTRTHKTHILYYGYSGYDTLYYTNSGIPDWAFVKIDSLESGHQYVQPDMTFDSLGNVHLVWGDHYHSEGSGWVKFMCANNSTNEWVKQQVSSPIWLAFSGPSAAILAVQRDGTAHIAHGGGATDWTLNYYVRNDSLNDTNWVLDTLPKPSVPFYAYYAYEIMIDENDSIHLFTGGGEDWEYRTGYLDFYYHKQCADSTWSGPDSTYQPQPDDLAFWGAFIDAAGCLHASLIQMGFMIPTHNHFYTDNRQGSWEEPYQILDREPHLPTEFRFVIDSEGEGHGAFVGLQPGGAWDSTEIYYLGATTGVGDNGNQNKTHGFRLFQNYPNPFNASSVIEYQLKEDCHVELNIYNLLGRKVRTLESGARSTGPHSSIWNGKDSNGKEVATGVYFYQLRAGDYRETKKLVLTR